MDEWSVSTTGSKFAFMDMSYVTSIPQYEDASVYVCIETEGQSACPPKNSHLISENLVDQYRVSISQERNSDARSDAYLARVWAGATVDFS